MFVVRLFDNYSVPLVLGGFYPPLTNLEHITASSTHDESPLLFRALSAYRGELHFTNIRFSQQGRRNFTLLQDERSLDLAAAYVSINVLGKLLKIFYGTSISIQQKSSF